MEVVWDQNLASFVTAASPLLYKNEAENSLILDLCERLLRGDNLPQTTAPLCLRAVDNTQTIAVGFQTPPYNLILSSGSAAAMSALAAFVFAKRIAFPGVIGLNKKCTAFIAAYEKLSGKTMKLVMQNLLYKLEKVVMPKVAGALVQATAQDIDRVAQWMTEFVQEAMPHDQMQLKGVREAAAKTIAAGNAYFWRIGSELVAYAQLTRPTKNGTSIGGVYTPPALRKNGYASGLVAHLSQKVLDEGKAFCILYADIENRASNAIYQRLGYQEIGASTHFVIV